MFAGIYVKLKIRELYEFGLLFSVKKLFTKEIIPSKNK